MSTAPFAGDQQRSFFRQASRAETFGDDNSRKHIGLVYRALTTVAIGILLATAAEAQTCKGDRHHFGQCATENAVCSPVNLGSGQSGRCKTANNPNREKECNCVGQAVPPSFPFNLVASTRDFNQIPLNPLWQWQVDVGPGGAGAVPNPAICPDGPYSPGCTNQSTDQDNGLTCEAGGYDGHHNWSPATYEGEIYWKEWSTESLSGDDDYNLFLIPPNSAGLTTANEFVPGTVPRRLGLKLEFKSDETIANFSTPWWVNFRTAVTDYTAFPWLPTLQALNNLLPPGSYGVVTGLFGLDCAHDCQTELHPVWAWAVRVQDDANDEVWSIFVRRSGDEGFCSRDQHILDGLQGDIFAIRIPWRSGAGNPTGLPTSVFSSALGLFRQPQLSILGGPKPSEKALRVAFFVPPGEMVNGELHLQWGPGAVINPSPSPPPAAQTEYMNAVLAERGQGAKTFEDNFRELVDNLTPQQRAQLVSRVPARPIASNPKAPQTVVLAPEKSMPSVSLQATVAKPPTTKAVADPYLEKRDHALIDALHEIFGPKIPKF